VWFINDLGEWEVVLDIGCSHSSLNELLADYYGLRSLVSKVEIGHLDRNFSAEEWDVEWFLC